MPDQQVVLDLTYDAWLDADSAPDLLFSCPGGVAAADGGQGSSAAEPRPALLCLLTCSPERYAAAQAQLDAAVQAADRGEQDSQSEQAGASSALPIPLSPLEYEALQDAALLGELANEQRTADSGSLPSLPPIDPRRSIHLALAIKAALGGRVLGTVVGERGWAQLEIDLDLQRGERGGRGKLEERKTIDQLWQEQREQGRKQREEQRSQDAAASRRRAA